MTAKIIDHQRKKLDLGAPATAGIQAQVLSDQKTVSYRSNSKDDFYILDGTDTNNII
jgi:hypothetical protein